MNQQQYWNSMPFYYQQFYYNQPLQYQYYQFQQISQQSQFYPYQEQNIEDSIAFFQLKQNDSNEIQLKQQDNKTQRKIFQKGGKTFSKKNQKKQIEQQKHQIEQNFKSDNENLQQVTSQWDIPISKNIIAAKGKKNKAKLENVEPKNQQPLKQNLKSFNKNIQSKDDINIQDQVAQSQKNNNQKSQLIQENKNSDNIVKEISKEHQQQDMPSISQIKNLQIQNLTKGENFIRSKLNLQNIMTVKQAKKQKQKKNQNQNSNNLHPNLIEEEKKSDNPYDLPNKFMIKKYNLIKIARYKYEKQKEQIQATQIIQKVQKYKAIKNIENESLIKKVRKKRYSRIKQLLERYKKFKEDKQEQKISEQQNRADNQQQIKRKQQQQQLLEIKETDWETEVDEDKINNIFQQHQKKFNKDLVINSENNQFIENKIENKQDFQKQMNPNIAIYQPLYETQLNNQLQLEKQKIYNNIKIRKQIIFQNCKYKLRWVENPLSRELDQSVMILINRLNFAQQLKKINQPQKVKKFLNNQKYYYQFKKRIVAGYNECKRTFEVMNKRKKSKMIILALNIQEDPLQGGLDELIFKLIEYCKQNGIYVIHSCSRRKLGMAFSGKVINIPQISCISIIDYHGYQNLFEQVLLNAQVKT